MEGAGNRRGYSERTEKGATDRGHQATRIDPGKVGSGQLWEVSQREELRAGTPDLRRELDKFLDVIDV